MLKELPSHFSKWLDNIASPPSNTKEHHLLHIYTNICSGQTFHILAILIGMGIVVLAHIFWMTNQFEHFFNVYLTSLSLMMFLLKSFAYLLIVLSVFYYWGLRVLYRLLVNGHEFWQTPGDSEGQAWHAVVLGVAKCRTRLRDLTTATTHPGNKFSFSCVLCKGISRSCVFILLTFFFRDCILILVMPKDFFFSFMEYVFDIRFKKSLNVIF